MYRNRLFLAAIVCLAFPTISVAQELPDANKHYVIANRATSQVLAYRTDAERRDIKEAGPFLITEARQSTTSPGVGRELWRFTRVTTEEGLFLIQILNSELNIDANQTGGDVALRIGYKVNEIGANLRLHQMSGAPSQKFYLIPTGVPDTYYLSSLTNGLVLDGNDGKGENGKPNLVELKGLTGKSSQKWKLIPAVAP